MFGFRRRAPVTIDLRDQQGCEKHPLDPATAICSSCERSCCDGCTLDVRGTPRCLDCGIVMAGLRSRRRSH
jgi:hypothetical protein